jgi:hypothetical protein
MQRGSRSPCDRDERFTFSRINEESDMKKFESDEARKAYFREKKRALRARKKAEAEEEQRLEQIRQIGQKGDKGGYYRIVSGSRGKNSVIHELEDGDRIRYLPTGVRCGIVPARGKVPAGYVIGAIESPDRFTASHIVNPLRILSEHIHGDLGAERFFEQLVSDADLYCFTEVFTNCKLYESFQEDFYEFAESKNLRLSFCESPPAYHGRRGLDLLRDWMKSDKLRIDKSLLLFEQASSVGWSDLDDKDQITPVDRFFLIDPLIYLVSSFKVDPPKIPVMRQPRRVPLSPHHWMRY